MAKLIIVAVLCLGLVHSSVGFWGILNRFLPSPTRATRPMAAATTTTTTTTTTKAPILEVSRDVDDLKYIYYETEDNGIEMFYNNKNSIQSAQLQSNLPVVITIDGFLSNTTSPMTNLLRESYTKDGGYNLIVLDWSELSGSKSRVDNPLLLGATYLAVLMNVEPIGKRLAAFLEELSEDKGIPLSDMTIVGGSLGAHIAGAAGAALKKKYGKPQIGRIAGLDPAGPFFSYQINKEKRLYKGQALYVDIYHANRGKMGDSDQDTGDVNIYINSGDNQPGCEEVDKEKMGVCSHAYGFKSFNYEFNHEVKACPCSGTQCTSKAFPNECDNPVIVGPRISTSVRGRHYVRIEKVL